MYITGVDYNNMQIVNDDSLNSDMKRKRTLQYPCKNIKKNKYNYFEIIFLIYKFIFQKKMYCKSKR